MTDIAAAINAIDKINAVDPNQELVDGVSYPSELLHSIRLTDEIQSRLIRACVSNKSVNRVF